MFVGIGGPSVHHGERAVEVAFEEGADGELGGAEACEKLERVERESEVGEAVGCDEIGEKYPDEIVADARGEGTEGG